VGFERTTVFYQVGKPGQGQQTLAASVELPVSASQARTLPGTNLEKLVKAYIPNATILLSNRVPLGVSAVEGGAKGHPLPWRAGEGTGSEMAVQICDGAGRVICTVKGSEEAHGGLSARTIAELIADAVNAMGHGMTEGGGDASDH